MYKHVKFIFSAIQCDQRCSQYSPCISTCPEETCDTVLMTEKISKTCKEDTCIEGCNPKPCPSGSIYLNSTFLECVPRNVCKPICMEIEGKTYYEGDLIEEDDCHSCYCSRYILLNLIRYCLKFYILFFQGRKSLQRKALYNRNCRNFHDSSDGSDGLQIRLDCVD